MKKKGRPSTKSHNHHITEPATVKESKDKAPDTTTAPSHTNRGDKNKHDQNKPMWDLLPFSAVEEIVSVLTYGASKYSPNQWKKTEDSQNRYFAALMRHITAWKSGEILDKESGLTHLAHAGCCLLFLMKK